MLASLPGLIATHRRIGAVLVVAPIVFGGGMLLGRRSEPQAASNPAPVLDSSEGVHRREVATQAASQHASAAEALSVAQTRLRVAAAEAEAFVVEHFSAWRRGDGEIVEQPPAQVEQAPPQPARPVEAPRLNPDWVELQERVRGLDGQLAALTDRFTPAHPQVMQLQADRQAIAAQLAAIPQYLPALDAAPVGPPRSATEDFAARWARGRQQELERRERDAATFARLSETLAAARSEEQRLLAGERDAWRQMVETAAAVAAPASVVAVGRIETSSRAHPAALASLSLAAGLAAALLIPTGKRVIKSPRRIQSLLDVPVLAILPARG